VLGQLLDASGGHGGSGSLRGSDHQRFPEQVIEHVEGHLAGDDGALSLTALASAIYGYHYVGKCKEERRALRGAESSFASQRLPVSPEQPVFPSPVAVQTRGKRMAVLEFQGRTWTRTS